MEELLELRQSISSGDYAKALLIVDEMEAMSLLARSLAAFKAAGSLVKISSKKSIVI